MLRFFAPFLFIFSQVSLPTPTIDHTPLHPISPISLTLSPPRTSSYPFLSPLPSHPSPSHPSTLPYSFTSSPPLTSPSLSQVMQLCLREKVATGPPTMVGPGRRKVSAPAQPKVSHTATVTLFLFYSPAFMIDSSRCWSLCCDYSFHSLLTSQSLHLHLLSLLLSVSLCLSLHLPRLSAN